MSNAPPTEMYRYEIPKTAVEALGLDRKNGNTKWIDAIKKEISILLKFQLFEIKRRFNPNTLFPKSEGWQFAPLHWVFAVKHGGRHKARLVIGGHVKDASEM